MTEVVTSFAAESQLNLLASRQQGFGVSGTVSDPTTPAPTVESNALKSALLAADKTESQSFASDTAERDANTGANSGPSRPRVEIKQFDVGPSPSEVVGTPDVLQRFDANRDGRLDMMEGSRAALVRQNVFTFAGLAAAPSPAAPSAIAADQPPPPPPPPISEGEAPALARETGAAIAALGTFDAQGLPKKFAAAEAEAAGAKKYYDNAAAVAGTPSGTTDAPKKYYGQGVEVVAGQAVNNGSVAPTKYADRVPVREQTVSEEGTGEVKYYDRVPQTESSDGGDNAPGQQKYHDKALEVLEAYVQAATDEALADTRIATVITA